MKVSKIPTFEAILIVDNQWMMGKDTDKGSCKIADFPPHNKFISAKISGNVVCYGLNTFAENNFSPLPDCTNIVISAKNIGKFDGCTVVHDIPSLFEEVSKYNTTAFVLGGQRTFRSLLPYINKVYLTVVHKNLEGSIECPPFYRVFIPTNKSEIKSYYKTEYEFREYQQFFKTN